MKQLTTWTGSDNSPQWSPDGKYIAYLRSTSSANYIMYDQPILCVVSKEGGEPRLLSAALDRPVANPRWSKDGLSIAVLVTDDRKRYVSLFSATDGHATKLAEGEYSYGSLEPATGGNWLATMSGPQLPTEIYALENGKPRRLTKQMDEFLSPLSLATVEGLLRKARTAQPYQACYLSLQDTYRRAETSFNSFSSMAALLEQDDWGFDLSLANACRSRRLCSCRCKLQGKQWKGLEYCKIISADWGNKEVMDLHGAVDYLVNQGIADPDKLGVGGWSYGGILTDYLIASDTRFKAACSGAGTGFTLSLYGVDQYVSQYENEIGPPWKSIDKYLKISYPLLKADRIKTPTLFMSGEKDFNVPTAGSEQMYQALRSLGISTQLIVYPGQFHGITIPGYQKDRFERYLAWYDKYVKK